MASAMQSWVGKPESVLIGVWGVQNASAAIADGGKVDTWVTNWDSTMWIGQSYAESVAHSCRKSFTINSEGTVTSWAYNDCP